MQNGGKLLPFLFSFPLQASLNHLFNNGNKISLKVCYFILGMATFLIHIKFPFLLTQMWHISNRFCLSHMFIECVRFRTQDDILSLHIWTHNALHMISISKITLENFCPWKLCNPNLSTLVRNIIFIKKIFNNGPFFNLAKPKSQIGQVQQQEWMSINHSNTPIAQ